MALFTPTLAPSLRSGNLPLNLVTRAVIGVVCVATSIPKGSLLSNLMLRVPDELSAPLLARNIPARSPPPNVVTRFASQQGALRQTKP